MYNIQTSMIDCHAHLVDPGILPNLERLMDDASRSGVHDVIAVAEDLEDASAVLKLSKKINGVQIHRALGLHPEKATLESLPKMMELIREHARTLSCVGETGLDYSPHVLGDRPGDVKAIQQECMKRQVQLANGHHAIALLQEYGSTRAVLHAFDGKAHYAEMAAKAGFYLSVPPCVVRSPLMQKWVKRVPLDRLLLETDCPALAPEKGQTNAPSNLIISCRTIAEIKGVSVEEVQEITTANAKQLFNLTEAWEGIYSDV